MCLAPAGYEVDGIHEAPDPVDAVRKAEGIFIGEEHRNKAARSGGGKGVPQGSTPGPLLFTPFINKTCSPAGRPVLR